MKQSGNQITGDIIQLDGLTKNWAEVVFHPTTFYKREDEICNTFKHFEDLYTTMDVGYSVVVRMNSEKDALKLVTRCHEFL